MVSAATSIALRILCRPSIAGSSDRPGYLRVSPVSQVWHPNFNELLQDPLPAVGVGARYVLSKKYGVNLAIDLAEGRNGTQFYFSVGEAF